MQHITFLPNPNNKYKVAIIIKGTSFNRTELLTNYVVPLEQQGLSQSDIIAFDLDYNSNNKAPVSLIRDCLNTTLKALDSLGVEVILCCDGNYFKTLTKQRKSDPHYGYVLPVTIKGFEHMNAIVCANHSALLHDPSFQPKIDMGVKTLANYIKGSHVPPGTGIIKSEYYPKTNTEIDDTLKELHKHATLTCDIETFGLNFATCGVGSIAFAWNQHEGVAFTIDYVSTFDVKTKEDRGMQLNDPVRKRLLKEFFEKYEGTLIYHNSTYDIKVLIFNLWMDDLLDQRGLLEGLEIMTKSIHDTKIITYLATNSCAGNHLGLKENVQEFAGNYAQDDIKDIRFIPWDDLLRYNLVDCLSTYYLLEKNFSIMKQDSQLGIYTEIMIPSVKVVLQAELSGMPMDDDGVNAADTKLTNILEDFNIDLFNCPLITKFTDQLRKEEWIKKNLLLKVKVRPIEDFDYIEFNPNSNIQVAQLLYLVFGFDIIDKTDSGAPAVGAKTLKKLLLVSKNTEHTTIIKCLIGISEVSIIINTFIAAFKRGVRKSDGMRYLHGGFNINGTKSGRMSSSKP